MINSLLPLCRLAALIGFVLLPAAASAHPHVWVTVKAEVLYAPDGSAIGVRQSWTFDDMYSAYSTQGLAAKTAGQFSRDELASVAKENIDSVKDADYYTFANVSRKGLGFKDPIDYYLEYDAKQTVLTLHFTLLFKTPIKAKEFQLDIYDPEYFIDFSLAENRPVSLVDAPASCQLSVMRPDDTSAQNDRLPESFFQSPAAALNWGAQFANKISVKCP
jgi:ABC-type uncharacterized transport system substrate-binding protein